jgi:predicted RNA methylase
MLKLLTSNHKCANSDHFRAVICPVDFSNFATHAFMLRNVAKYQLFSDALSALVENKRVLEIGTGSGILALVCALHRAKKVVAVERLPMASVARKVFESFPVEGRRIELVEGDFYKLDLSQESFDVILSETVGYLGYEEDLALILYTAKQRYGHADTIVVPSDLKIILELLDESVESKYGQPFLTFENFHARNLDQSNISEAFKLGSSSKPTFPLLNCWHISKDTTISGVIVYFNCVIQGGVQITNRSNPFWPRCVVPFELPIQGRCGEDVKCELSFDRTEVPGYSFRLRITIGKRPVIEKCFNTVDIQAQEMPSPPVPVNAIVQEVQHLISKLDLKPKSVSSFR